MTEIVIGHERREGIGAGTLVFTIGLCVGVLIGSIVGVALVVYEPDPGRPHQATQAQPGEHCECWPTQASP